MQYDKQFYITGDVTFSEIQEIIEFLDTDSGRTHSGSCCETLTCSDGTVVELPRAAERPKRILINIDSCGGQTYPSGLLIDKIKEYKGIVDTHCYGWAMSASFSIYLAGETRTAVPTSEFMIHSTMLGDRYSEEGQKRCLKLLKTFNKSEVKWIKSRTKLKKVDLAKETRFLYKEAKRAGIVNK